MTRGKDLQDFLLGAGVDMMPRGGSPLRVLLHRMRWNRESAILDGLIGNVEVADNHVHLVGIDFDNPRPCLDAQGVWGLDSEVSLDLRGRFPSEGSVFVLATVVVEVRGQGEYQLVRTLADSGSNRFYFSCRYAVTRPGRPHQGMGCETQGCRIALGDDRPMCRCAFAI